jgi:hypothetical protein
VLQITSTNVLRFTDTTTNIDTTTTIPASTWVHVAVVRTGTGANGLKLYINAVDSATGTSGTNFNQTEALNIGADRSNANAFNGYISNLKYTVGTAESISVPASPITGGTVLLNFTNAGIFDAATINNGQTVGNAQVSTTQAKWPPTGMYFDGTGDYLTVIDKPELRFGTAPFTVEFWLYASTPVIVTKALVSKGGSNTGWQIQISGSDEIQFIFGSTAVASAVLSSNTWTHVAVVREGTGTNQTKIYVGGVNTGVATVSTDFNQTSPLYVGASRLITDLFTGYIQDLRITNGVARYTANFTAPTAAFPTL